VRSNLFVYPVPWMITTSELRTSWLKHVPLNGRLSGASWSWQFIWSPKTLRVWLFWDNSQLRSNWNCLFPQSILNMRLYPGRSNPRSQW
jgi:hypothetical protein